MSAVISQTAAAPSERLRLTEIFLSLQGESNSIGWPTVFVRLTGCPLRCQYCDTAYAFHGGEWWEIDAILASDGSDDALYDQAVAIVAKDRKCSTSYIQRKLAIGYNKAARLVEQMEEQGVVSSANHVGKREVLVPEV